MMRFDFAGASVGLRLVIGGAGLICLGLSAPCAFGGPVSALVAASLTDLTSSLALYRDTPVAAELETAAEGSVQLDAPPSLVAELVVRAHERGLTAEQLLTLLRRTQRLAGEGLPVGPVLSRYLEGMAKGVSYSRIEAVTAGMESSLVAAGARFDARYPVPTDDASRRARLVSIDNAAYVLGLGISPDALDSPMQLALQDKNPYEAAEAPLLALGILVGSGIAPETSLEVVSLAWENGYRGETMERLGVGLSRAGGNPAVVAEVLEMISSGAAQDRVFEGLDELVDRNLGMRAPGLSPGEDPGTRRGRTPTDDEIRNKVRIGDDRPLPGN